MDTMKAIVLFTLLTTAWTSNSSTTPTQTTPTTHSSLGSHFSACHFHFLCYCKYSEETNSPKKDAEVFEFSCLNAAVGAVPTDYKTQGGILSHVSLVGSPLLFLDASSFSGVEVQDLQLTRCGLYAINDYALSSMSNSLTVLDLADNHLPAVPFNAFSHLKALEWLNLSRNKLDSLSGNWFSLSHSLRQLTLSSNSISSLPPKLLSSFRRLIWLDVQNNYIDYIVSPHSLPPHLQTLILGGNPLTKVPLAIFSLRSLSWLSMAGCAIEKIQEEWPRGIAPTALSQLDLSSNSIQHWPSRPFSSQLKVLDLDLSKNYMHKLPPHAFQAMSPYRLSLGHNRLNSIDAEAFATLGPSLQYLNLDNNRLDKVPWEALSNLTSLRHLYLGNNLITNVDPTDFDCPLYYLSLNGNGLDSLPHLSKCLSLIHLNLGYNRISTLSPFKHQKHEKLATLVLRSNPIGSIATATMPLFSPHTFPSLQELSLSFCELEGQLQPFLPLKLTTLELSGGIKEAMVLQAQHFQQLKELVDVKVDHNSLIGIGDYAFYGNKNLSSVNLEFNRLGSLPRQMFHPDIHGSITEVRLAHNKIEKVVPESFLSFPNGATVDLSHNLIKTIEKNAFTNPKDSTTNEKTKNKATQGLSLYLQWNRIESVENNAFNQEQFHLVDLSHNSLTSFDFASFGMKTMLVSGLNISHNAIETLEATRHIHVKWIDASHNKLTQVKGVCPSGKWDLSFNLIKMVDGDVFGEHCGVKELDLSHNEITHVDPFSFSTLPQLTVLDLSNNNIRSVQQTMFIVNPLLKRLDLSSNKIRSLPRDSLVGASIEILLLANNQFVNLPVGALQQISRRLKILDLSHNSIEHLDSTMGDPLSTLVRLSLAYNRLSILPDNAFALYSSLQELDLSGNTLVANFKELFHFLPWLKTLSLSACGIKSLPPLPLPHLLSLDVSHNQMVDIHSLETLNSLRTLDLSSNRLTNGKIHLKLSSLTSLNLRGNPIRSLTRDLFVGTPRLQELNLLDMDHVDRFDSDVLSMLSHLRILLVDTFPSIEKYRFRLGAALSGAESLESLLVQIKEPSLTDQLFGGILPTLNKLSITGKNLKRIDDSAFDGIQNCRSIQIHITNTSVQHIPGRLFELLHAAEWVKVDLSFNNISTFTFNTLYPNSSMWQQKGTRGIKGGLSLSGNPLPCTCSLSWLSDWQRRWLRESFESSSLPVTEGHREYDALTTTTCVDDQGNHLPLVSLQRENLCRAEALSMGVDILVGRFHFVIGVVALSYHSLVH